MGALQRFADFVNRPPAWLRLEIQYAIVHYMVTNYLKRVNVSSFTFHDRQRMIIQGSGDDDPTEAIGPLACLPHLVAEAERQLFAFRVFEDTVPFVDEEFELRTEVGGYSPGFFPLHIHEDCWPRVEHLCLELQVLYTMVNRHPESFTWHMQDVIANIQKLADKTRFPRLQILVIVLDITTEIMNRNWPPVHEIGITSLAQCLRSLPLQGCGIVQHDIATVCGTWWPNDPWSTDATDVPIEEIARLCEQTLGPCWLK